MPYKFVKIMIVFVSQVHMINNYCTIVLCFRHFILRIVEVFLMKLIPEINDSSFKARLERLRTLKVANSKSSLSSLSAFHRRTLPRSDTI